MDELKLSHRDSKSKFVRIDAKKRGGKGHVIITCEKDKMSSKVKYFQDLGYEITNIKEN